MNTDREAEFEAYWEKHLVSSDDPQLERWRELERTQVSRAQSQYLPLIEKYVVPSKATVLDVGCQCGALAVALSERGAAVTGIDVEENLLVGARLRAKGYGVSPEFVQAVGEALPFESGSFSLVTLIDVIEHVEDIEKSLAECVRVLAPGGVLIVQGPNRWAPRWFWSDPHYRLLGISVLPPRLGRWYVTKVRRRPRYDVGTFPVALNVLGFLQGLDMRIESAPGIDGGKRVSTWDFVVGNTVRSMFTIVCRRP